MNIKEATEKWVSEMNAIQWGIISKLMSIDIDDWHECTTPSCGDRVYVYDSGETGEISKVNENDTYTIDLDNGEEITISDDEFEVERHDCLPMWGTMWSFKDSCDDWWLSKEGGIKLMSQCGFRIYESEEFGYFFGIDGAGYDFYELHWIPLYKARGLRWHDEVA